MKTRILFLITATYIFLAFGWWTWSLIALRITEADQKTKHLQTYSEQLKLKLSEEIYTQLKTGHIKSKEEIYSFAKATFTETQFLISNIKPITVDDNFSEIKNKLSIEAEKEEYIKIDLYLKRKILQYILEGLVFIGLLLWGMILLYRNINNRLRLNQQENNFLLAVTHELKTPLASIRLIIQTLKRRSFEPELQNEMYESALTETNRLESLVENILMATRIENKGFSFHMATINLSEILEDSVSRLAQSNHKNQKIETDIDDHIELTGDEFTLTLVFDNLLSNSMKYAPANSSITLSLRKESDKVVFVIRDQAPTIPETERIRIFEKFYRIGNEETRSTKGTGLGLYIVKQILKKHQAHIVVKPTENSGNIFEIVFNTKF